MKIAIMQPYFFPYIGQFQLIHAADRFLLCDDVQYIRHGWINRNRILKPDKGSFFITAPLVKHKSGTLIKDIQVTAGDQWKTRILRQTEYYRTKAPYYQPVIKLLTECFRNQETNIARLNGFLMKQVCDYIGIDFAIEITSEMNLDYSKIECTEDWAIRISEQLGAKEYLNPPGGMGLYDRSSFEKFGIKLGFIKPNLAEYDQRRQPFEPGLSIIDIMMFNTSDQIRVMLDDYQLLT